MNENVWISWEDHRRSMELANELEFDYCPITTSGSRLKRYLVLPLRTLFFLYKRKPKLVVCQNPSVVLAFMLCTLKSILGFKLCVDRHSNFKFETENSRNPKWFLFHYLSQLTVRKADLTIVTNDYLQGLCQNWGGDSVVLQDKLPKLNPDVLSTKPTFMFGDSLSQVMFVTMFDDDEPIYEIIDACKKLSGVASYLTGNYKKLLSQGEVGLLKKYNICLTGFVSNKDYLSLMRNVDVVVVLTNKEYILNCGAYEAYSMRKPVVLANTKTLRGYFKKGVIFVDPFAPNIAVGISEAIARSIELREEMADFIPLLESSWRDKFSIVKDKIYNLSDS